jgi:hypothetical protein
LRENKITGGEIKEDKKLGTSLAGDEIPMLANTKFCIEDARRTLQ